jgi:hypothetical protein
MAEKQSIVERMAAQYKFEPEEFKRVVKKTCMPSAHTEEEFLLFLASAHELELNPLTREIYAFSRPQGGGIQHIIAADGWYKKANQHPANNGMTCTETFGAGGQLISCTATVHRKDRDYPTVITEYLKENARNTDTWRSRPVRMLRHRALSQAIRIAYGFAGVMDEEEFAKWQENYTQSLDGPVTMIESAADSIPSDEPKTERRLTVVPEPPTNSHKLEPVEREPEIVEPEPEPEPEEEPEIQYLNPDQQSMVEMMIMKGGWPMKAIPEVLKVHAGVDASDKIKVADLAMVMKTIEKAAAQKKRQGASKGREQ